jgi:D-aspartate ligase
MSKGLVPAVIVGFENNGLGVARALTREGIPSVALAGPKWSPSCASWTSKVVMSSGWSEESLVTDLVAIGKRLRSRAPLLITKEEPVLWISENRATLSEYFNVMMPEPEVVRLLMHKVQFHTFAQRPGWPLPKTWPACDRAQFMSSVDDITYPCILKPAVKSAEFRRRSPRKAFKLYDTKQLREAYDLVSAWEPELVVQEWIGGGDDRVAFALGYWGAQSRNVALFPGRKLRQWPPECGDTALSEPAPPEWRKNLIELTTNIFSVVGYRGLGSIEYKVSPDEGRFFIMEPTVGRTNYQNEVAVLNGVNLPAIAYYDGIGRTSELERLTQPHRPFSDIKLIDAAADRKSARFYIAQGQLTRRDWLTSRRGPKQDMLYRHSDPLPLLLTASLGIASFVKHRIIKPAVRPLLAVR